MKLKSMTGTLALASGLFLAGAMVTESFAQTSRRARPSSRPAQTDAEKPKAKEMMKAPGDIMFEANNQVFEAKGTFEEWKFTKVNTGGDMLSGGEVELEIAIDSIKMMNKESGEMVEKLTNHMKASDYFNAAEFPKAMVKISNPEPTEKDDQGRQHYKADGQLKLMGSEKPLEVSFMVLEEDPLKIKGSATVNREEFGVGPKYDPEEKYAPIAKIQVNFETVVKEGDTAAKKPMTDGGERKRPTSRPAY